ncbi:hypothetical protein Tco_0877391 [Tanacetum coccineum]|uniref:Uncharacterized protein n=1 Tax=Tanacetum coccineum TaxID=301880 RepID=A0ABQ5BUY0_9ASTR
MWKSSRNKKRGMENLNMFYQDIGTSSSTGRHLIQEEASKEALVLRIGQKFALLEEVRPVLETMAYHDKYKKVLDEIWKEKVELNGMIVKEEEEAIKKDILNGMGCDGEIDDMLRIKLREAESNDEIFTSVAWIRAFNIKEQIYAELFHEIYLTYEFDEVCVDDELQRKKIIKFRHGGRAYNLTLLEFARRLGLYHADELQEDGFDVYFQGGLRSDDNFNAQEYWLSISRAERLGLSRSHASTIRNLILRVVHKMITYGLCQRTTRDLDTTTLRELIDPEEDLRCQKKLTDWYVTTEERPKENDVKRRNFGGNDAQGRSKTLLKQMYNNFNAPSTEYLTLFLNWLSRIIVLAWLAIFLGEIISQE